jgi:stage II sporulation protein D
MPHAPQPDAATRVLVPALSLGLTTLLCCAESAVTTVVPTAPNRFTRPPPATTAPDAEIAPPVAGEPPTPAPAFVEPSCVRVRLARARAPARIEFGITGAYRAYAGAFADLDPGAAVPIATGSNLQRAFADLTAAGVRINGQLLARTVTIIPEREGALRVGSRRYPGGIVLEALDGELAALNVVDLEDYVAGVLYAEMPDRFAVEALRAQAVVTRSYAVYHTLAGRDLRDDQGSQVYAGLERVDATARRVVDSTLGEILTFDGIPLESYFHSTCGGSTSSARAVFGIAAPPPIDRAVRCDDCRTAPNFSWTRRIARSDLDRLYKNALGTALRFVPLDRDDAGRSTRFEIFRSDGKSVDRPIADRLRNDFNAGKPLGKQLLSTMVTSVKVDGKILLVEGRGFGHGVGLCQYGAGGAAARGATYRDILARYYPGATLRRLHE